MILRLLLLAALLVLPLRVAALALPENARLLTERISLVGSYNLPVGRVTDGALPERRFEGTVERRSWRLTGHPGTTLQVLEPIRTELGRDGYDILLDCAARDCGGFDFRFATEVIPAPDMYVTLHDFRFLAAIKGDQAVSVLVSSTAADVYIQIITVTPIKDDNPRPPVTESPSTDLSAPDLPALLEQLKRDGGAVLGDLDFGTGSDKLADSTYPSLEELAGILTTDPALRIAIVGHTDNVGQLDRNIALSKRRAQTVRDRLIATYGIAPARIDAEGMGYLAPRASNLTDQGREANRRVEVILLQP